MHDWVAHQPAETLVAGIGGAHFVAVAQQIAFAVERYGVLLGQNSKAGALGIAAADQKIAVAADKVNRCFGAEGFEPRGGGQCGTGGSIVAQPGFE